MSTRDKKRHPPRWLDMLAGRLCARHLREQVMGDLHERFYRRAERVGEAQARKMYYREVLAYLRPSTFRRKRNSYSTKPFSVDMLANYFKVAIRSLLRKKVYSGINVLGSSIGLACTFFILVWVFDETGYDNFSCEARASSGFRKIIVYNSHLDMEIGKRQTRPLGK